MTRHQHGDSALVSQTSFRRENRGGVAKFRLFSQVIQTRHKTALHNERTKYSYRQNAKPRKRNVTHRFSLHVTYQVLFSAIYVCVLNLNSTRGRSRKIVLLLIFKLPAEKHEKRQTRNYHPLKFINAGCRTNIYKFSFFPKSVKEWNELPGTIIEAANTEAFKLALRVQARPH